MSRRNYLLNTSLLSSDQVALSLAVRNHGAKVVEVAECINNVPLPFLTLDVSELLSFSTPDKLSSHMEASLGENIEALDYLKDVFIAYYDGKLPYTRADFLANKGINDPERIDNTISLDAAIQEDGTERQY